MKTNRKLEILLRFEKDRGSLGRNFVRNFQILYKISLITATSCAIFLHSANVSFLVQSCCFRFFFVSSQRDKTAFFSCFIFSWIALCRQNLQFSILLDLLVVRCGFVAKVMSSNLENDLRLYGNFHWCSISYIQCKVTFWFHVDFCHFPLKE